MLIYVCVLFNTCEIANNLPVHSKYILNVRLKGLIFKSINMVLIDLCFKRFISKHHLVQNINKKDGLLTLSVPLLPFLYRQRD